MISLFLQHICIFNGTDSNNLGEPTNKTIPEYVYPSTRELSLRFVTQNKTEKTFSRTMSPIVKPSEKNLSTDAI